MTRGTTGERISAAIAIAVTKNCTFEPVLDGEQGREVTRAFNAVVNG